MNIDTGYTPGLIGRVAELHGTYYAREWRFGAHFEAKVAAELAEFMERYDASCDRIWWVEANGRIEGSLTVDGSAHRAAGEAPSEAHFRWFILSDELRGTGVGQRLMADAVEFCRDRKFERAYLWTFAGLSAARHLYEKAGFALTESTPGQSWGTVVEEQRFERAFD